MIEEKGYDKFDDDDYKYLIKMPMDSVTEENIDKLFKEYNSKEDELESLEATTISQIWLQELENLYEMYLEYKEQRERLQSGEQKQKKKVVTKTNVLIKNKKNNKSAFNLIVEE